MNHVGRFAPSPSGQLHFGSFITALGSYLQAKSRNGEWLVRIEDIDPPREVAGAAKNILITLEQCGLYWDRDVFYQSKRLNVYQEIIDSLINNKFAYYCDCTRQRIQTLPNHCYDNHCRNQALSLHKQQPMAIRIKQTHPVDHFIDNIRGHQYVTLNEAREDFIIYRKDGLFAYNFAVVIDDHEQGITEIVRGADLLPVTTKQLSLYQFFGFDLPCYYHLPLALNHNLSKLSKQNHARPISTDDVRQLTINALIFLGQAIPDNWQDATQTQILQWAIEHWQVAKIPRYDKVFDDY